MKILIHFLIAAAIAAIIAPAFAKPHDARARGGMTAEQLYFDTATRRERASQPLWAPDLNDRNAVY